MLWHVSVKASQEKSTSTQHLPSKQASKQDELTFSIYFLAEFKCGICGLAATKLIVPWPDPDGFGSQVSPRVWDAPMKHIPL